MLHHNETVKTSDLLTVNRWAERIHCDRRTIARRLRGVQPAAVRGGHRLFSLAQIAEALATVPTGPQLCTGNPLRIVAESTVRELAAEMPADVLPHWQRAARAIAPGLDKATADRLCATLWALLLVRLEVVLRADGLDRVFDFDGSAARLGIRCVSEPSGDPLPCSDVVTRHLAPAPENP